MDPSLERKDLRLGTVDMAHRYRHGSELRAR
jgi:hypothetical protein